MSVSDAVDSPVDAPMAHGSSAPSADAPDAPGGQEPESPTARAADAARAVEAPSRALDEPGSEGSDDPVAGGGDKTVQPAPADGTSGEADDSDDESVTSPRLERLKETIAEAKEAAHQALGSTPQVDTSLDA